MATYYRTTLPFILFLAAVYFLTIYSAVPSTFRAAVVEHAVILPRDRNVQTTRDEAKQNMDKNLEIYMKYTEEAATRGAGIIVFPEDGLYGPDFTWWGLTPYLEYVPDPSVEQTWIPCIDPTRYGDSYVQVKLSCMARNNSVYLVANMGDRQPCLKHNDPDCPLGGHYQYNTDVTFDPQGRLLARYHKQNLFYEFQFSTPKSNSPTFFDTPFGRFGLFTCFDILFHSPAIDLIHGMGIRNIAFPTAWMDVLPHLAAIEFHSAYAAGLGLNFLAANIHWPEIRFHGSGIYGPKGVKSFYYNNSIESGGKLLVHDLDIIKTPSAHKSALTFHPSQSLIEYRASGQHFHSLVFHDMFEFQQITEFSDVIDVCNNGLCCRLSYSFAKRSKDELYAFGAFRGLHTYEGTYFVEICLLLKCSSTRLDTCGEPVMIAKSVFSSFSIQGNFSTNYVFPEILLSDGISQIKPATQNWTYAKGTLKAFDGFSSGNSLLSSALFSRNYDKDDSMLDIVKIPII